MRTPELKQLDLNKKGAITCIPEENYMNTMLHVVEPELEKCKKSGYFVADDSAKLYYESYSVPNPAGTIVISHGFIESVLKYKEMIYYFTSAGYQVYGLDHRGHGRSERLVKDISLVHITSFDQFVADFKCFLDSVVKKDMADKKLILYAHSMGGAIGALFLEKHPDYFQKAILSSPMMEINSGKFPKWIARFLADFHTWTGKGASYVYTHKPFNGEYEYHNAPVTSEVRYQYYFDKILANDFLKTNGSSFNWLSEAYKATEELKKNADKIQIPVLLFKAAADSFVHPEGYYQFAKRAKNVTIINTQDTKHELYKSTSDFLCAYLNAIFEFIEADA
ncbi:alpha/beta hydrolase [Anaeromicropila populeti]|uniref:Lysophospholipase n=1 Tax=Anaeromicropila populeti TaxID=37658 RepID=A0A1I6KYI8_9FIRM|nr:alpha/beta hydrolase [Anaeromicropila populeti]SFR96282.1 lysophospholipase [Anaeromicropila populeti]